jgi:hypothetical protein
MKERTETDLLDLDLSLSQLRLRDLVVVEDGALPLPLLVVGCTGARRGLNTARHMTGSKLALASAAKDQSLSTPDDLAVNVAI